METQPSPRYVIITPVRDEAKYIEATIKSVVSQTVLPVEWVIVDDGSTDGTGEIIAPYAIHYRFIRLLKGESAGTRNFGRKVAAFNVGFKALEDLDYEFIGNLDGDVSLGPDYYANILAEFLRDPKLGIAGGIVFTKVGSKFYTDDYALDSVGGAVQVFRRECFEEIGGYLALPRGGIDAAAEIMARMKGWTVRKFPENKVWENRRTGSVGSGSLRSMYNLGVRFHTLGYGTGFFTLRCVYKASTRPWLLGSLAMLLGFGVARVRKYPLSMPPEAVVFLRREQREKIRKQFAWRGSGEVANHEY